MENNKTYFLDLNTLLTYLQKASFCTVTTRLKLKGKTGMGSIMLQSGKVLQSKITWRDGETLEGPQAFKLLETCTEWQVRWGREQGSLPVNQTLASPPLRQKRQIVPAQLRNLSPHQQLILRTILTMIDGRRSVDDLKAQLNLSPETIDQVLGWLRSLDIIE